TPDGGIVSAVSTCPGQKLSSARLSRFCDAREAWACAGSWGNCVRIATCDLRRGQEVRRSHHASRVAVARMSAGRRTAIRPRVDKGDGARRPAGSPPHARGPGGAPSVAGENSARAPDVGGRHWSRPGTYEGAVAGGAR